MCIERVPPARCSVNIASFDANVTDTFSCVQRSTQASRGHTSRAVAHPSWEEEAVTPGGPQHLPTEIYTAAIGKVLGGCGTGSDGTTEFSSDLEKWTISMMAWILNAPVKA